MENFSNCASTREEIAPFLQRLHAYHNKHIAPDNDSDSKVDESMVFELDVPLPSEHPLFNAQKTWDKEDPAINNTNFDTYRWYYIDLASKGMDADHKIYIGNVVKCIKTNKAKQRKHFYGMVTDMRSNWSAVSKDWSKRECTMLVIAKPTSDGDFILPTERDMVPILELDDGWTACMTELVSRKMFPRDELKKFIQSMKPTTGHIKLWPIGSWEARDGQSAVAGNLVHV